MIRCGNCNASTPAGQPTFEVATEQRNATYPERWTTDKYEPELIDAGGEGRQIVKTVRVGECCINKVVAAE